jgi:hypothetical protein
MKTQLISFIAIILKILLSIISILILTHLVFIIISVTGLKIPSIAQTKSVNFPLQIFMTDETANYKRKLPGGSFKDIEKYPFNFTLYNIKDSADFIHVTSVTGNLAIDVNNKREILLVVFLKRIAFLVIFFILLYQLDKVYSTFKKKEPFNPENVRSLKIVAYSIISLSPVILVYNILAIQIFKNYKITGFSTIISNSLNLQYIFFGLLILIIAYVFDRGAQLQEDSDFTV